MQGGTGGGGVIAHVIQLISSNLQKTKKKNKISLIMEQEYLTEAELFNFEWGPASKEPHLAPCRREVAE